jgi:hypothetical protein
MLKNNSNGYFGLIDFVCPACKEESYLICSQDCIETWDVSHILVNEKPSKLEYDGGYEPELVGEVYDIRCGMCGHIIGMSEEEACNWLLENKGVKNET